MHICITIMHVCMFVFVYVYRMLFTLYTKIHYTIFICMPMVS